MARRKNAAVAETIPEWRQAHEAYGKAQESLEKAGQLLSAAAKALGAGAAPRASLTLVQAAKAAIRAAIETDRIDVTADVYLDAYRLYSLVLVAGHALEAPEPLSGESLCENPTKDTLELAAEMAGEDHTEGLCARFEELMHKVREPARRDATLMEGARLDN